MTGKVTGYSASLSRVFLKSNSVYKVVLPIEYLFEDGDKFEKKILPLLGREIEVAVRNHVNDTLYVSARASDLAQEKIQGYRDFYKFIEEKKQGDVIRGTVLEVMPFGVFVDMGSPYFGLIDIGHNSFNRGEQLPLDFTKWPQIGEPINCVISYYRFSNKQIGLGWLPDF